MYLYKAIIKMISDRLTRARMAACSAAAFETNTRPQVSIPRHRSSYGYSEGQNNLHHYLEDRFPFDLKYSKTSKHQSLQKVMFSYHHRGRSSMTSYGKIKHAAFLDVKKYSADHFL
uniref:Uncharacterized protein n=1 Tax=Trichogramma kaykai TaxID=54128 RepID=A0ABD2VVQ8_9HYME